VTYFFEIHIIVIKKHAVHKIKIIALPAIMGDGATTKKWTVFDVLKPWSKKPRQNFLTWQKLKRQKS
jgi:hypothetical protein